MHAQGMKKSEGFVCSKKNTISVIKKFINKFLQIENIKFCLKINKFFFQTNDKLLTSSTCSRLERSFYNIYFAITATDALSAVEYV